MADSNPKDLLTAKSCMNMNICKEIILKLYIHNNITPTQHLVLYCILYYVCALKLLLWGTTTANVLMNSSTSQIQVSR